MGIVVDHKTSVHRSPHVGASLLAMADYQALSNLDRYLASANTNESPAQTINVSPNA